MQISPGFLQMIKRINFTEFSLIIFDPIMATSSSIHHTTEIIKNDLFDLICIIFISL